MKEDHLHHMKKVMNNIDAATLQLKEDDVEFAYRKLNSLFLSRLELVHQPLIESYEELWIF